MSFGDSTYKSNSFRFAFKTVIETYKVNGKTDVNN